MKTLELLQHTDIVNELLARIIDCYEGEIIEELRAPADGIVFFMHGEPLTYSQTAVFKLILHEE